MNKTYRSVFTGKEIDEAIIFLRNTKKKETVQFSDVTSTTTKTLFSFDYTKNNYMSVIVIADNYSDQLFVMEFKALSNKIGTVVSEMISSIGTSTDLFTMDSNASNGKCNITLTASSNIKSINAQIVDLL